MNKIQAYITALLTIFLFTQGFSQFDYSIKVESGYSKYIFNIVNVDPGPNWKGYNLDEQDGIDINIVSGIAFKKSVFAGVGLGYVNFEGVNGLAIFSDFEIIPLKSRLRPLINVKLGYSHIWNQYENGTGTVLGEICAGINYRLREKMDIYIKSGFTMTQQSLLIPIRLGVRF